VEPHHEEVRGGTRRYEEVRGGTRRYEEVRGGTRRYEEKRGMRPLTAEDEAALRSIAERHGFLAARGPHTGEGSASRLIDALLAGEVVTLALSPADRRRLA